jgi:hypothetical protein
MSSTSQMGQEPEGSTQYASRGPNGKRGAYQDAQVGHGGAELVRAEVAAAILVVLYITGVELTSARRLCALWHAGCGP